jgi:hypothetical protein
MISAATMYFVILVQFEDAMPKVVEEKSSQNDSLIY